MYKSSYLFKSLGSVSFFFKVINIGFELGLLYHEFSQIYEKTGFSIDIIFFYLSNKWAY